MGHDPGRFVAFPNRAAELLGDPLGEGDGRARGQPHVVDVLDRANAPQQSCESLGGHDARVAARDDHVSDFRVRLDPCERGLERRHRACPAAVANETGSRAESAIDAAAIGRDQQDPIWVASNQMGRDFVGLLAERVAKVALDGDRLFGPRECTGGESGSRVDWIAEREVVRRDRDRQPGRLARLAPIRSASVRVRALSRACKFVDRVLRLPAPVAPFGCVRARCFAKI